MFHAIRRLVCAAFAIALTAAAAESIVVRAEPAYMNELAARFKLKILDQIPGHPVFLVEVPAGVSKTTLTQQLLNYDRGGDPDNDDDDDDDVLVEDNRTLALPEPDPGGTPTKGSSTPVQNALKNTSYVDFYGDIIWSGVTTQPALSKIRVPEVRRIATGAGIVAVIDTGIDPEHPMLRRWLVPGYDFVRNKSGTPSELDDLDPATRAILQPYTTAILDTLGETNPYTTAILDKDTAAQLNLSGLPAHFGHGTMAAGLVRTVAPAARIMALKAFDSSGRGTLWAVLKAIYFAEKNGARIVNMSLSFNQPLPELERAVDYVSALGVTCVASAGNQALESMVYPAGYKAVMGIASTTITDVQSSFTNHGDNLVTIAAPGEALIAPYPGGLYAAAWGTSFSAPLVSGTVSLIHQVNPKLNWEKVEGALKEAAPVDGNLGSGRLDVYRAVTKARGL
jgi:subtilisin family serine protease